VVIEHYDDDWAKLGWVMLRGRAKILPNGAEHDRVQALLPAGYRQLAATNIGACPSPLSVTKASSAGAI